MSSETFFAGTASGTAAAALMPGVGAAAGCAGSGSPAWAGAACAGVFSEP
jgi:hypothetical protein